MGIHGRKDTLFPASPALGIALGRVAGEVQYTLILHALRDSAEVQEIP